MTVRIRLEFGGAKERQARLSQRANFLGRDGLRPLLQEMGKETVAEVVREAGRLSPGQVKDLSPAYKPRKAALVGHIYPVLHGTGQLLSALVSTVYAPRSGEPWRLRLSFRGQHHSGLSAQRLYEVHRDGEGHQPKRDLLSVLSTRFLDNARARLRRAIQRGR